MATIIFKPTEKCNSNCIYCDVVKRKDQTKVMSYDLLEIFYYRINDFLISKPNEEIFIVWHGGEPLLLGVNYFKKALEIQSKTCSKTYNRIKHSIQSNLTLMNQKFIDVFREMGIDNIGTSYESLPNIRGPGENHDSVHYNKLFSNGIKLLNENNLGWGFIYVVTRRALEKPLEIFYHLTNLAVNKSIMLNPVLIYGEDNEDIAITPVEFAEFLGEIFPEWWKNQNRFPEIDPFSKLKSNIVEGNLTLFCSESGKCSKSHIYVGPDGELSQCGRSGDWNILDYGNIRDVSFEDVFDNEQKNELNSRDEYLMEHDCKDCRFWKLCHGGCPLDSYTLHKDFHHKTEWCEAKKLFIEKYFEPITGFRYN